MVHIVATAVIVMLVVDKEISGYAWLVVVSTAMIVMLAVSKEMCGYAWLVVVVVVVVPCYGVLVVTQFF